MFSRPDELAFKNLIQHAKKVIREKNESQKIKPNTQQTATGVHAELMPYLDNKMKAYRGLNEKNKLMETLLPKLVKYKRALAKEKEKNKSGSDNPANTCPHYVTQKKLMTLYTAEPLIFYILMTTSFSEGWVTLKGITTQERENWEAIVKSMLNVNATKLPDLNTIKEDILQRIYYSNEEYIQEMFKQIISDINQDQNIMFDLGRSDEEAYIQKFEKYILILRIVLNQNPTPAFVTQKDICMIITNVEPIFLTITKNPAALVPRLTGSDGKDPEAGFRYFYEAYIKEAFTVNASSWEQKKSPKEVAFRYAILKQVNKFAFNSGENNVLKDELERELKTDKAAAEALEATAKVKKDFNGADKASMIAKQKEALLKILIADPAKKYPKTVYATDGNKKDSQYVHLKDFYTLNRLVNKFLPQKKQKAKESHRTRSGTTTAMELPRKSNSTRHIRARTVFTRGSRTPRDNVTAIDMENTAAPTMSPRPASNDLKTEATTRQASPQKNTTAANTNAKRVPAINMGMFRTSSPDKASPPSSARNKRRATDTRVKRDEAKDSDAASAASPRYATKSPRRLTDTRTKRKDGDGTDSTSSPHKKK